MDLFYLGSLSEQHTPNTSIDWYGGDCPEYYKEYLSHVSVDNISDAERVDGKWQYHFNAQGYRGEAYNPDADFTLGIFGCSVSIGEAVPIEQTWGYHFRQLAVNRYGFTNASYLNFSQSGASNDYITRTALRQCESQAPSLLIAYFTHCARKEILEKQTIHTFGSWCAQTTELHQSTLGAYTQEEAFLNALKNAVLLQDFCKIRKIPYLFVMQDLDLMKREQVSDHPVLSIYWDVLDWTRIAPFRMKWIDVGRDNRHPGPRSHRKFAQGVFDFYESSANEVHT